MRTTFLMLVLCALTAGQARAQGLVVFVQQGCPACRSAEPELIRLESAGTRVVRYRATAVDPVCRTLGITITPTFIAVDRHGREVQRIFGGTEPARIAALARQGAAVP
jgi:thiol-disulfide isomerase/thioredoxin